MEPQNKNHEQEKKYNYTTFQKQIQQRNKHFLNGPKPGEKAPDFDVLTLSGYRFHLRDCLNNKPILLIFGSITCPMTVGSRPTLLKLHKEFSQKLEILFLYVREAHPGERYPHHTSFKQKLKHARDFALQEKFPFNVAVDELDGSVHRAYGALPNSAYLIGRDGHVAFRCLWAGQKGLLHKKIKAYLNKEAQGESKIILGEKENHLIPLLHGAAEFEHSVCRAGKKSEENYRHEMGLLKYTMQKIMSKLEPLINPKNRALRF